MALLTENAFKINVADWHVLPALPAYIPFITSEEKFTGVIGGFGCAKSWHGAQKAFRHITKYKGSHGLCAGLTYNGHCKNLLLPYLHEQLGPYVQTSWDEDAKRLGVYVGNKVWSTMMFTGLQDRGDFEQIMHQSFDWIWLDELTSIPEDNFYKLFSRLRGKVIPESRMWFTTVPGLWSHYLREELQKPRRSGKRWEYWQFDSSVNTYLPSDYVETMSEVYFGGDYQRYVLGDWATITAGFFKGELKQCSVDSFEYARVALVCDPAASERGDFTMISVYGWTADSKFVYMHAEPMLTSSLPEIVSKICELYYRYKPNYTAIEDCGAFRFILNEVREKIPSVFGVNPGGKSKEDRASELSKVYANGNFYWAIENPKAFQIAFGQFMEFPLGKHDDAVDTASYAYDLLKVPKSQELTGVHSSNYGQFYSPGRARR